ncbi:karyopherin, partial [Linderina pennispora]
MDSGRIQQTLQALELIYGASTTVEQRREAEALCEQVRESEEAALVGVQLSQRQHGYPATARHFGLRLIEDSLRSRWSGGKPSKNKKRLTLDDGVMLRDHLWQMLLQSSQNTEPQYIREKLVSVFVMLVVRMWPSSTWVDLSSQMMHLYMLSGEHRVLALRIWQTLGEEVFVYENDPSAAVHKNDLTIGLVGALLPRQTVTELYPHGYRVSVDSTPSFTKPGKKAREVPYEPGNEDGWLLRWAKHATEIAQHISGSTDDQDLLASMLDAISVYLDWVPVRALAAMQMIPCLADLLRVRSDTVRRRAASCLETISRRNVNVGEYRDTILLEFASNAAVLGSMAQAYLGTVKPAAETEWDDTAEALAAAKTISQTVANLVTIHWARKKLDINVLANPQPLIELLLALGRDMRYTVSSQAMACWTAIVGHPALSKDPVVLGAFSTLAEHTTTMLFKVCRASHLVGELVHGNDVATGIDSDEADQFESPADLRSFLSSDVRSRLLGILRSTCKLEPTGFVQWILPSLLPVLDTALTGNADVAQVSVAEAAFITVDTILSTLDDYEQRALEDGDMDRSLEAVRPLCYQIGEKVVGFVTDNPTLMTRQLQTLPSFAFLLRPSAMGDDGARTLLFNVLKKCTSLLKAPDGPAARELRTLSRRATGALVRIAIAIPDSLMVIYGDLSDLVQANLSDPQVSDPVKCYLGEFLLTLIAGASCSLSMRKDLAGAVIRPLVESLNEFLPALQSPQELVSLLGLPALDANMAGDVSSECKGAMDRARRNRFQLMHVLSTLQVCLTRTLGGDASLSLAAVWSDYVSEVAPAVLMLMQCLHALWNPANWQQLPWQSAPAQNLFGLLELSSSEMSSLTGAVARESQEADLHSVEIRAIRHTLNMLRESSYRCIGCLAHLPELYDAKVVPDIGSNFAACLFADAAVMTSRHWKMVLVEIVRPVLLAIGSWPTTRKDTVRSVVAEFVQPWLIPMLAFCSERLTEQWSEIMQKSSSGAEPSVDEDIARERLLRDWTRAFSSVTADLLASMSLSFPEAAQIENELASSARITIGQDDSHSKRAGNYALGAYILQTPELFAAVLTASLHAMQLPDTHASHRTTAALARLAPSLAVIGLLQHYAVPTPAHASTVNSYLAHVHPSLVDNKSGGTILS